MQAIIVFIIMALGIIGGLAQTKEIAKTISPAKTRASLVQSVSRTYSLTQIERPGSQAITKPEEEKSAGVSIETFIKFGPSENEIIDDTNKVVFGFRAEVSPEETEGSISFETKIEGFDNDWKTTYSSERGVELPGGVKNYSFLVRARINNTVDQTPAKRNFKLKISPYFGKLKFSDVEPPDFYTASLITLSSKLDGKEKLKITDWKIEGEDGSFVIPQGVEKYDSFNPLFKEDIFLQSGDTVYISGDLSPIWTINFRPNKCLGYLDDGSRSFTVPISKDCPQPEEYQLPSTLEESCWDYIQDLEPCESLNSEKLEEYDIPRDSSCFSYIETNFCYSGCFENYSQDNDFLEKEWHIYMNISDREQEVIDWISDTVYLKDQNGLFVDKYDYDINEEKNRGGFFNGFFFR